MSKFKHTSHSTGSDDGLWMRTGSGCVEVYEFAYWEDLDASAIPTHGKYNVQSGYVYLPEGFDGISATNFEVKARVEKEFKAALRSWGFVCTTDGICQERDGTLVFSWDDKSLPFVLAECAWLYGQKYVVLDVSGNNRAKLIRAARGAL